MLASGSQHHAFFEALDAGAFELAQEALAALAAVCPSPPWQGQGVVALAQLNPWPAHVQRHATHVGLLQRWANLLGVDWLLLPEGALMGYPVRDLITRHPHVAAEQTQALATLAQASGHTRTVLGWVEPNTTGHGRLFFNSAAVLGAGGVQAVVRKSLLPNYEEYEDWRTFEPAIYAGAQRPEALYETLALPRPAVWDAVDEQGLLHAHGQRVAITLCEDAWADALPLYPNNPVAQLMAKGDATLLVNLSASVARWGRGGQRHAVLRGLSQRYPHVPVCYANSAGAIDETVLAGESQVWQNGQCLAQAPSLHQGVLLVQPKPITAVPQPLVAPHWWGLGALQAPVAAPEPLPAPAAFAVQPSAAHLHFLHTTLVKGIADYFAKVGFQRAVLGLSGGLDSAVCAVLLAEALGPTNVFGFSFPTALTPEDNKTDAAQLAHALGIGFAEVPIGGMVQQGLAGLNVLGPAVQGVWGAASATSFAKDNVQAMSRATLLRLLGNEYHALPVATSDKSECYLGYTTVNGDMSGALAPLGDVCKTQVRALAHWLNAQGRWPNALPLSVVERPSGADLAVNPETGQLLSAEEALMPYAFADEVIWRIETLAQDPVAMLHSPFAYELVYEATHGPLPMAQKRAWLVRFYQRMAASVFKWWLLPPVVLVSSAERMGGGSLAKSVYHHPITARYAFAQALAALEAQPPSI